MVLYGGFIALLWTTLVRAFDRLAGRSEAGRLPVRR
jgi:hypothetical protein